VSAFNFIAPGGLCFAFAALQEERTIVGVALRFAVQRLPTNGASAGLYWKISNGLIWPKICVGLYQQWSVKGAKKSPNTVAGDINRRN